MTDHRADDQTPFSDVEEWLHSISHGIGAALSLAGMVVLLVLASLATRVDPWKLVGISLYGASLVLLYTASTLYHGVRQPHLKRLFQLLDHCAIYLLIAGTYTPFLLVNLRGPTGWTLFAIVWTLTLVGIACKLIWPQRFTALRIAIYLVMGWLIVFAGDALTTRLSTIGLVLLIAGGVTYTLGVAFYAISAIPFNHAIWHLFVMGGSICHFLAVYTAVLPFTA
ncbi:PAQR family membrane homeostasis protein TrhA [Halomonas ventosae]|uniref:Channel protein (Hemolysin III family) n=1 Tax=Halomonas ventosae TaxID=229007 RepID=A0A4R6HEI3_9GAMM|nr:hemolysin III family protein [Halomonas ventosae]TDO06694.1 channel protein (hemolysin III family) [Halomonas ventosae]